MNQKQAKKIRQVVDRAKVANADNQFGIILQMCRPRPEWCPRPVWFFLGRLFFSQEYLDSLKNDPKNIITERQEMYAYLCKTR
jgi:hypothetical protein